VKRWIIGLIVVLALAAAGGGAWWLRKKNTGPAYRTAPLERGAVIQTVHATGVIKATQQVQVGTQVNGPVQKLFADFNARVKAGDLVAQIDPAVYEARLAQDQANLLQSEAAVEQAQAKLLQAEKELARASELVRRDLLSQSELDAAVANRDALAAQLKLSRAQVEQSKAALRLSQANLAYTTIRSPVDGIVIGRNVDEGQTVVASMSAQTLFTIAADLRQVLVEATIPEADIGKLQAGQPVTFRVDAYEEEFTGTVQQVRLAAATVQNVVTYPAIIRAANPDLKLFPGMTANVACEVARRDNALKVSNAALRFKPETKAEPKTERRGKTGARTGGGQQEAGPQIWHLPRPDAVPVSVRIKTGITDGLSTEILEPCGLEAGAALVIGYAEPGAKDQDLVNPFAPRFPSRTARRTLR
jgi:HlyD family secretion protein